MKKNLTLNASQNLILLLESSELHSRPCRAPLQISDLLKGMIQNLKQSMEYSLLILNPFESDAHGCFHFT